MAVTRTSTGTLFSSAAAGTVTFGAGATAGDLGILIVETANQSITTPAGWTGINTGGTGTAGAASASMIEVFAKVSITSGDISGGISISDSGDHQNAILLTYNGYDTLSAATAVIQAFSGGVGAATTAVSIAGAGTTTTVTTNDIVLAAIVTDRDSATVSTNASAAWANITGSNSFIVNVSSATGQGGGIIVNELVPSANQTGNTTFSCTITSSIWLGYVLVIKAPCSSPFRNINPMLPLLVR